MTMTPDRPNGTSADRPNPGSPDARAMGCICPDDVLQVALAWQCLGYAIAKGCPVHDSYSYGLGKP